MRKWLYHGPGASNPKSKPTLFPPTLKVEGNKVVLFFGLEVKGLRYSHFIIFGILSDIHTYMVKTQGRKWPYLGPRAPNPKSKITLFP